MFESFVEKRGYADFVKKLLHVAKGYADVEEIGKVDEYPLHKLTINPKGKKTLCVIAGLHGNEEAGPLGVLAFLKTKMRIPRDVRILIIPMANPHGFEKDKRRNGDNTDINRHFLDGKPTREGKLIWKSLVDEAITLVVTLHEDPKARHFYLYFTKFGELAGMVRDMATRYFPLRMGPQIRRDKGDKGLIPPPHEETGTIEDKFQKRGTPYFTTEPPGTAPLAKRVEFMKEAIKLIVHNL